MKRARVYYSENADRAESADHSLLGGGILKPTRSWREVAPHGLVGDPTLAKAQTGEKFWDLTVNWMAEAIRREFT